MDDRLESREEKGGKEMDIKWPSKSVTAALKANYQANGVKPEMRWAWEMIEERRADSRKLDAKTNCSRGDD